VLKEGRHGHPLSRASIWVRSSRSQAACPSDDVELIPFYIGGIDKELSRSPIILICKWQLSDWGSGTQLQMTIFQ
jgi:hypothetical protein